MHWKHQDEEATPWLSSKDAVLVTDGHRILAQYACKQQYHHEVVKSSRCVRDVFHVQDVNQHHSALKAMVNEKFRGVSS